jgi:hypothetical protein
MSERDHIEPGPEGGAPPLPTGAEHLCRIYQLTPTERRVLTALLAHPEGLTLAALAQQASLTAGDEAELCARDGALRVHGLVETDEGAELGLLRAGDRLYPARGLSRAWSEPVEPEGAEALFCSQAPGIEFLPAPPPDTTWARDLLGERAAGPLQTLLRDHLLAREPRLLWLQNATQENLQPLAQLVRTRLTRPVVLLDCQALAGSPPAALAASLRRLRRDADLHGAVVLAAEVQALQGQWRALCAPRPVGQTGHVILAGNTPLPWPVALPRPRRGEAGLSPRAIDLRPEARPAAAGAPAREAAAKEAPEPVSASAEEARRRAAIDAALAMGRPIPSELVSRPSPAPAAPPSTRPEDPPVLPADRVIEAPTQGRRARTQARAQAAPPPAATPPAATPPAPEPPAAGQAEPAAQAQPEAQPAPAPAEAAPAPAPAAPEEELPPIPLEAGAPLEEIIRVCRVTPNAQQRIEILRALAGQRHSLVIQVFRLNLGSAHPGVRQAAEEGMASLFGPNWKRPQAIAPPVQPPRSEDNGRGPHGAF